MTTVDTAGEVEESNRGRSSSLSGGAAMTFIASNFSMLTGMATSVLTARLLGPALKGNIDLMNATIGLCVMVFGLSLASGITYWTARGGVHLSKLVGQLICVVVGQGLVVWLVMSLFRWTPWLHALIPVEYSAWGPLLVAFGVLSALLLNYCRSFLSGLQQFALNAGLDIVARSLNLLTIVAIYVWVYENQHIAATAILLCSIVINIITAFAILLILRYKLNAITPTFDIHFADLQQVWQYARITFLGNLVQFLNYRLDMFLIAYFVGTQDLSFYVIAVSIAQLLWLPALALQSVLFPKLTGMRDESKRVAQTAQFTRLTLALTFCMALVLAVIGPWGIHLLYSDKFAASTQPLLFLLPGIVIFGANTILAAYFDARGKQHLNLAAALAGVGFTVLLNLFLLPKNGIVGAAIASSFAYTATTLLTIYFFWKHTQLSIMSTLFLNMSDIRNVLVQPIGIYRKFRAT